MNPPSDLDPVLSVRGLEVEFRMEDRTIRPVDGLSYDLPPGRTLAIAGESGSGKSVHALSILGLLPSPPARVAAGEILYRGKDLLKQSPEDLRTIRGNRIAMIFQEPMTSLNPVLTIGDQIAEAAVLHQGLSEKAALEKAAHLLAKVGIPNPERRIADYPHQFSGGMRQRAMIAMALSCDPEILIADEPTTALDVTIQAQILDLLRQLQNENKMSIILITHNMGVAAGMADEVIIMYAGRAVEKASAAELFKNPRHPYTNGLLRSIPSLHRKQDRLAACPGQPPELTGFFSACPFAPRCLDRMDRCDQIDTPNFRYSGNHLVNCLLCEKDTSARSENRKFSGKEASA